MNQRLNKAANGLNLRVKGPRRLKNVGDAGDLKISIMAISQKLKEVVVEVGCESGLCLDPVAGDTACTSSPIVVMSEKAGVRVTEKLVFTLHRHPTTRREAHAVALVGCNVTDEQNFVCPPGPQVRLRVRVT